MKFRPLAASLSMTALSALSLRGENLPAFSSNPPPAVPELAPADPIHKLVELETHRRIKPFELLKSAEGEYPGERLGPACRHWLSLYRHRRERLRVREPACTEVVAETPLIERVLQHIAVEKPLGATPVSVSFDVPHDGQYLLWAELQAQHVTSNEKIAVLLDGAKRPIFRPMWDYVTTGWDNPAGTPFFDTLKSDGQTNPWYALKAGSHHLEFTLPTGTAEIVSFTATNDAGYLPEGISSFHHPPLKH